MQYITQRHNIYEVDPLLCPICQGAMKFVAFIENLVIIEKNRFF